VQEDLYGELKQILKGDTEADAAEKIKQLNTEQDQQMELERLWLETRKTAALALESDEGDPVRRAQEELATKEFYAAKTQAQADANEYFKKCAAQGYQPALDFLNIEKAAAQGNQEAIASLKKLGISSP
jgi:hypothetical protein